MNLDWSEYIIYFLVLFNFLLRHQLFNSSLTADLHQDVNIVFEFSWCLTGTFYWRKRSVKALESKLRREDLHLSLFSFLNVLIPSRKCSIKPPTKRINSVYVLTKNWHLGSKYLNDYLDFFDLPELYDRNARPNKHSSAGSLLFTQLLLPSSPTQFWIKW